MNLNYRDMLNDEFLRRKRRNEKYSLRCFASHLELSPGYLSQLLKSSKKLSVKKAESIIRKMPHWTPLARKEFVLLVKLENSPGDQFEGVERELKEIRFDSKQMASAASAESELDRNFLDLHSSLYNAAVYELLKIKGVRKDAQALAQRLGLSIAEVREILDRLMTLGMVQKKGNDYVPRYNLVYTPKVDRSEALQKFHIQVAEMIPKAISEQPTEQRQFMGATLGFAKKDFSQFKGRIEKFIFELVRDYESSETDCVYHLEVGFFQVDHAAKKGEGE